MRLLSKAAPAQLLHHHAEAGHRVILMILAARKQSSHAEV